MEARAAAAVARPPEVGAVAAGRVASVAGRALEAGVAGGRWEPGRGRSRKEPTESKWTAFCESSSYLRIPSFLLLLALIVDAVLARKLLEGQMMGFGCCRGC